MVVNIREMVPSDWDEVKKIYQQGLDTGLANFRENAPSWDEWNKGHLKIGRLIACSPTGDIYGWAALSPVGGN